MNEQQLYEKQYGEKRLLNSNSFPLIRKILKKYDIHREDLAINLLDRGEKLLDIGCGSGSLVFKAKKEIVIQLDRAYL